MPRLTPDDVRALIASANRVGANPRDYAAVMSFESGLSPSIMGGAGGRHGGLIQFGPAERQQYGANINQSFQEQLPAVERYLTDRGFKPGMGMMDLYSTVNAGRPGRYNASDAANGGTWGSVADKVNHQFGRHYATADALLAGYDTGGGAGPAGPSASPSGPFGFGAGAAPRTQAYTQLDPITAQPLPGETGAGPDTDLADISSLLGGAGGGAPAAPAAETPAVEAPAPAADSAPVPPMFASIAQAQQQFDPGRFYSMLPARRRRF